MGLATEGARACLEYGISKLNFTEVVSFMAKINIRSINVMKRIEMVYDGDFEHLNIAQGHPLKKHVLYKISCSGTSLTF